MNKEKKGWSEKIKCDREKKKVEKMNGRKSMIMTRYESLKSGVREIEKRKKMLSLYRLYT